MANTSVTDGVLIEGKHGWGRHMKRACRCLKFQHLNVQDMAADCNKVNMCGTCVGHHRTIECDKTNLEDYRCVNCNTTAHTSWDRVCLKFMGTSEKAK